MDDTAALALEIATARARIAGTAEALLYRADVKTRIGEGVADRLASARSTARERLAEIAAGWNGNGHAPNDEIVWRPAEDLSIADLPLGDVALADIPLVDVPLVDVPREDALFDRALVAWSSRNVAFIVTALTTGFIVWFLVRFVRRRNELQDRDSA